MIKTSMGIPNNVKKMIQNIKEISGNHCDDDVYAMLKDCSMDPNETAQKLLLQDTFHEVKRRRERKKENQSNRGTVDLRWRSGPSGRGGRGGCGNYSSRYAAPYAGVGRKNASSKENGTLNLALEKGGCMSSPPALEAKSKDSESSMTVMANSSIGVVSGGIRSMRILEVPLENVSELPQMYSPGQSHIGTGKRPNLASVGRDAHDKMSVKYQGFGKNPPGEVAQTSGSAYSRPLSSHGDRSLKALGSQKVGRNKEWKPKQTTTNTVQGHKTLAASSVLDVTAEAAVQMEPVQSTTGSEEATNKMQKELKSLHFQDTRHVIIPNHIQVPEAVRSGLSFGSFGFGFVITSNCPSEQESLKNSRCCSETQTPRGSDTTVEEQATSQNTLAPAEDAVYADNSQLSKQATEDVMCIDDGALSSSIPNPSDSKATASSLPFSNAPTSAIYNFGLMPSVLGKPLGEVEGSDTQARDASGVPSFAVQQSVDHSSFYGPMYGSGDDNNGRVSPFPGPGVASKYNDNVAVLAAETSWSPEGGNARSLSSAAQTPQTQATVAIPSSMAVTQQPMSLFRPPPGVHLPNYPPNYIPYGHYFSPFYVPPPAMHQFLGNNAFLPPAQSGVGGSYGPFGAPPAGYGPGSATTSGNSTSHDDLAASKFKDRSLYFNGQQTEGSAVWVPASGREISSLPGNSFYNSFPQGQHVTFGPALPGQSAFAGIYHPAQAVTTATVLPHLQQPQTMPGAADIVGVTASIYQPQLAQMNW